jgi:DNA-directed RNA polymerase subunit RPC12/RpoP
MSYYRGSDQRELRVALVSGMACPKCGGEIIDPNKNREDAQRPFNDIREHYVFHCVRCLRSTTLMTKQEVYDSLLPKKKDV